MQTKITFTEGDYSESYTIDPTDAMIIMEICAVTATLARTDKDYLTKFRNNMNLELSFAKERITNNNQ